MFGRGWELGLEVLNAFRHQRSFHERLEPRPACRVLCSTPFGIKGVSTVRSHSCLSARVVCSTPFGIKGVSTTRTAVARWSASSAQRLSASKEFPRPASDGVRRQSRVLNAFRHQRSFHSKKPGSYGRKTWCSTPFGIKGVSTGADLGVITHDLMCSTPFGIKGVSTLVAGHAAPPVVAVLNAFRHQRSFHTPIWNYGGEIFNVCSTPFGIKGVSTWTPTVAGRIDVACSTPFGIKGVSTSSTMPQSWRPLGAQRLSASKEFPPHPLQILRCPRVKSWGFKHVSHPSPIGCENRIQTSVIER